MKMDSPKVESMIRSKLDKQNLEVLENQLSYESMMNKKCNQYAGLCEDAQLKNICHKAAQKHKENYKTLLKYLNFYQ